MVAGAVRIWLIAGEPSGDRLGAALMAALRALDPGAAFDGVGGPLMAAQGLASLFPMEELSVMGLAEVIPRYPALRRRAAQAARAVLDAGPDALVTIDSPDFCLTVARAVKAARPGLRTVHYVAPSVWAWRPGRAARMARAIDHVLALLPFEPPFMHAAGMTCDFVGHPVVSEPLATPRDPDGRPPLICVLPGSRRGEVSRLAPIMGAVLGAVVRAHPGAEVVVPTVPAVAALVRTLAARWPIVPRIVEEEGARRQAFADARVALAASGTVSLELAANRCPMVIAYRLHPASEWLMRRAALVDTFTLVNLVSETRVVPEFLGGECVAGRIAPALLGLMGEGPDRAGQEAAMRLTMERLGQGGEPPAMRAARSVIAHL